MASTYCNKSFSSNYMIQKPKEASLLELFKMLFSCDVVERKFIDCYNDVQLEPFFRRWIMFLSILVQKLLLSMANPMARLGGAVEYWINLVSQNGGFFRLGVNSFRGKVIYPHKISASYLSITGNSDTRTQLDLDSKNNTTSDGDRRRYQAMLSLMASKAAYENNNYIQSVVVDDWKMNFIGSYSYWDDYKGKATTQACLLEDTKDLIVVAFRGTEPFVADDWISDRDLSWYELPGVGRIHGGFMKALGLQKSQGWPENQDKNKPETAYYAIRRLLNERLKNNEKAKFIVTGHSLGGALAALFPAILGLHDEAWLLERLDGVYTFGQPRVGDKYLAKYMEKLIERYHISWYRFVYAFDIVTRLPYDSATFMFKHFGTCVYYNSFYEGKVVEEEPNKNYFSLIWLIPKLVNGVFELIRSFIIPYMKGSDYRENGVMLMFRVIGLLVPGIPNHYFQDYHNATRLGSSSVFSSVLSSNGEKKMM